MTRVILLAAVLLVACGDHLTQPQALGSASAATAPRTATPTPLPSGVLDPAPLIARDTRLSALVRRVDRVTAKLTTRGSAYGPGSMYRDDPAPTWAIAVVGEVYPQFGGPLGPKKPMPCGVFFDDAATGDPIGMAGGPLSVCQPYFSESLTPQDEAVQCPDRPYDNGLPRSYTFTATNAGDVPLTRIRDDGWGQPTSVSGSFLMTAPVGSVLYQDAFCIKAVIRQSPATDRMRADAVGARANGLPDLDYAIWLRDLHAVKAQADADGHIAVTVEPRAGFEWAFFDWSKISTGPSYVMFTFVDAAGNEIAPWRLFNGP